MSNPRMAKILILCILAVTAIISIRIYAAYTDYIEVYTRDYVPSSIPTSGGWSYASIDVWRYTDGTSFGTGSSTGGFPLTKHPYYPDAGKFITYAWSSTFTDEEFRVKIYRLEGDGSWTLVATMKPRAWMWPNGNYGGSWAYSGYVIRVHP